MKNKTISNDKNGDQLMRLPYVVRALSKSAVTASGLIFGVASCSHIPLEQTQTIVASPRVNMQEPYNIQDSRTTSTNQRPSIAEKGWDEFYTDPKLKQLIQLALDNNSDLKSALIAVQRSQAQYQIKEQHSAKLGSNFQYSRSKNRATSQPSQSHFNVALAMPSYELDLWGKVSSMKQQALNNYLATTASKENIRIILISNVAQTYVSLSYANAQYQLAKATVDSRKKSLYLLQKRFEAGVDSKTPSLQAKASLEAGKIAMYDAETTIQKLKNALQILIGRPMPEQLEPPTGITTISDDTVLNAGLPSELLLQRPDILQAELQLKAAGANINVARSAYFPSMSLTSQIGLSSGKLIDLFSSSALGWSFAPSINLPIFDSGQRNANYQLAQLQQQQSLVNYEKSIQTAFKEVADVLAERSNLQKRLNSQYQLQASFNETFNIANARFKAGLSNYLGVLDAERSKFSTQQSILQLEQANLFSQIQLYQVLGGGITFDSSYYEDDIVDSQPILRVKTKNAVLPDLKINKPNKANTKIATTDKNDAKNTFKPSLRLDDIQ